ncbi:MAG: VIT domain-containing protein [Prosthecobacter sp.]|uniref:VIT domain-containing protein n=1 Tax=Prosthecobacter sp. TaxID=1965333 RepID=UPI0038FDBEF9
MNGILVFLKRLLLAAGMILPLNSLIMEFTTRSCASTLCDPIPTWTHVLLVLLMPAAIFSPWMARRKPGTFWEPAGAFLHGAGLFSSILYVLAMGPMNLAGLIMLPFTPLFIFSGVQGLLVLPLVLAALGPLAALVAWIMTFVIARRQPQGIKHVGLWRGGLVAGLLAVVAAEWRMVSVHGDIQNALRAVQSQEGDAAKELPKLRTTWRQEFLLRLCYTGGGAGHFGPLGHLFDRGLIRQGLSRLGDESIRTGSFDRETLRSLYFRVTGSPFSDVPPPSGVLRMREGFRMVEDERFETFAWDEDRGSSEVGARIRGLTMQSSRMDWHVDADSALAHGEWTLEFHNKHRNAQEARCQMLLPPGACVSRLTLWINGEPREAAFGARSQVTQAYRQTVVVDRRDPVLVNMAGPDRVLTQCFPVPPNGVMKIRLGITAPLDAQAPAALFMPLIVERNFSIPTAAKHAVWVQSPQPLEVAGTWKDAAATQNGAWTWQAEVPQVELAKLNFGVKQTPLPKVWTTDKLAGNEPPIVIVERSPATNTTEGTQRPVFVIVDSSAGLQKHAATIRGALQKLAAQAPMTIWTSTDGAAVEVPVAEIESRLQDANFAGGRDAVPAFKAALQRLRSSSTPATIIWLHGPQPAELSRKEVIKQLLERGGTPPQIHALELEHGRNKLLEELYDAAPVFGGLRWSGDDAAKLTATLQSIHTGPATVSRVSRAATPPADGKEVWDQLARHAVFREVMAVFQGRERVPEDQAKKAAAHQLVTPYSGAVVLENQQQYDRAGLKPVDADSTPQIPTNAAPEPSSLLLLVLGLLALNRRRR